MLKNVLLIALMLSTLATHAQSLSGEELLEKAIQYHDPNNNWSSFMADFNITMEVPNKSSRLSAITIDLPNEYFKVSAKRDTITTTYTVNKGNCSFALNDSENVSTEDKEKYKLNCKRAKLFKNYYTYLYGLPMKLKDQGTNIAPKVEKKTFRGKTYLVLKATYNAEVGSDIWYFYFNPENYAMEIYQFYKTDANGSIKKDSGEYILLTEEKTVNGIKMPKNRAWYYNKNDKLLGTDILN
ncbi:DUF6503 family protein [Seonamhaeicola marinus]|uniref:Aspartyl-tRNA synthetase n=1 Tax=Seonamhaeicola marinus TaxID=1912246 RepID=A0A5D0HWG2_9FLAO|nr:DUF6503 family protein [Seonamhaeicola marinus]TYA74467.1 hypothetical protein FUA24_14180 [Seonamhaeicola marinus]